MVETPLSEARSMALLEARKTPPTTVRTEPAKQGRHVVLVAPVPFVRCFVQAPVLLRQWRTILFNIDGFAPVREAGIAGDHEQPALLGQYGQHILGNAVSKEFLVGIARHVCERKNGNGRFVGQRRGPPLRRFLICAGGTSGTSALSL